MCHTARIAAELLQASDAEDPLFGARYKRGIDAGWPLLPFAQKSREILVDLTLEQILDMVAAIAKIPGTTSYRAPILQAALQALQTSVSFSPDQWFLISKSRHLSGTAGTGERSGGQHDRRATAICPSCESSV